MYTFNLFFRNFQILTLLWRHNEHTGVSNHRRLNCLRYCLFRRRSKKTSKLRGAGLCEGNSPKTGEFPAQMSSNAENVSIWWRHHADLKYSLRNSWLAMLYWLTWPSSTIFQRTCTEIHFPCTFLTDGKCLPIWLCNLTVKVFTREQELWAWTEWGHVWRGKMSAARNTTRWKMSPCSNPIL